MSVSSMDNIELRDTSVSTGEKLPFLLINDIPLSDFICDFSETDTINKLKHLRLCWTDDYDFKADSRFERFCLAQSHANVPILCGKEGFEFSDTVIVAEISKTEAMVFWHRIGIIDQSAWSFDDERKSGVLLIDKYSDQDWEQFGNTFVFEDINSEVFKKYVSEHWEEELYRRRINYTYSFYQNDKNVKWLLQKQLVFERKKYEGIIDHSYEFQMK